MSFKKSQRMVFAGRRGSVKFRAALVSVLLHLVILAVFGFFNFSQLTSTTKQQSVPTGKISQVKELIQTASIIPKPKIKKQSYNQFTKNSVKLLQIKEIFNTGNIAKEQLDFITPSNRAGEISFSDSSFLPRDVEFFGSRTERRKICYVVDCSGSMQGVFGQVCKNLKNSIESLLPDHYFYIIFFGSDRLMESGDGRMVRATSEAKSSAFKFIDMAQPAGQTNATAALERAIKICRGKDSSSVIYFLTDGFELTTEEELRFRQKITNLLRRFGPNTQINTIGFWTASDDREILEVIAKKGGGEFVLVGD